MDDLIFLPEKQQILLFTVFNSSLIHRLQSVTVFDNNVHGVTTGIRCKHAGPYNIREKLTFVFLSFSHLLGMVQFYCMYALYAIILRYSF